MLIFPQKLAVNVNEMAIEALKDRSSMGNVNITDPNSDQVVTDNPDVKELADLYPKERYAHDPYLLGVYDPLIYDAQSFEALAACVTKLRNVDLLKAPSLDLRAQFQDAVSAVISHIKVPGHKAWVRTEAGGNFAIHWMPEEGKSEKGA